MRIWSRLPAIGVALLVPLLPSRSLTAPLKRTFFGRLALACAAVAQNPDPTLQLTSTRGVTRTLDDWATVFNLAIVLLPARPEAAAWVPVIDRIYQTFGDSDVRTTICVSANVSIT